MHTSLYQFQLIITSTFLQQKMAIFTIGRCESQMKCVIFYDMLAASWLYESRHSLQSHFFNDSMPLYPWWSTMLLPNLNADMSYFHRQHKHTREGYTGIRTH